MKKRYKLTIAYDGYHYHGWQRQKRQLSVQETLEKALSEALAEPIQITGSGRTDSGAHAIGQVAHFDSDLAVEISFVRRYLPKDIQILAIEEVSRTFHARYSAVGKIYTYCVQTGPTYSPFAFRFTHHVPHVDLSFLQAKAAACIGAHNFQSFTNAGSANNNTRRKIYRVSVEKASFGFCVTFVGNGFLYKMVRNLMGAFLEERLSLQEIKDLLVIADRTKAPPPVPAKGLFLTSVLYDAKALEKFSEER